MKKRTEVRNVQHETILTASGIEVVMKNGSLMARYQRINQGSLAEWSDWDTLDRILYRLTLSRGATRRWAEVRAEVKGFSEGYDHGKVMGVEEGFERTILDLDKQQEAGVDISRKVRYTAKTILESQYWELK